MQDFRKLEIYKKGIQHCVSVYQFAIQLPHDEKYGLVSQIKRAACSAPLNISEGAGAASNKEFAQFVSYAYRSVNEVIACLELAEQLGLFRDLKQLDKLRQESVELSRMTYSFFKKIGGRTFNL